MPIESSTVTNWSPAAVVSRSVRPSVGRISARAPVTTCERLSLVETCTVSRVLRIAASVTRVSGVAATKLPPIAKKTLTRPSRIARMLSTASRPWWRGGWKSNSCSSASRNAALGRSKMPIVRSPWTLLCPRTGQTPAPGRPTLPRSSRKLTTSRMVGTACLCWVRPIAQQTMTFLEASTRRASSSICSNGRPVAASTCPRSVSLASAAHSSKPRQCSAMNAWSSTPPCCSSASSSSWLRARNSARSPPSRICRKRSVSLVPWPTRPRAFCGFLKRSSPASGSGLTLTMVAPARLARSSAESIRGWLVPGFWPATMIRSAW